VIRALTDDEILFISSVAVRLDSQAHDRLMGDLAIAQVEAELADGELIRFQLEGYQHPHRGGGVYIRLKER
jgi:hypothetical protein